MSDNMTDQLIWEKVQHKVGHFSSDFEKKNSKANGNHILD